MDAPAATYYPLGDGAVVWQAGWEINPAVARRLRAVADTLTRAPFPGYMTCVSGYVTLTVYYDPLVAAGWEQVAAHLRNAADAVGETPGVVVGRTFDLPVCYDGPDLDFVARRAGLTPTEVIALHTMPTYDVHFVGFAPGFPYLGGMDPRLATPRRAEPRPLVAAGAVGIAGGQTGVYPLASPGGWQLIGRTPRPLFDPHRSP
ncbi:MAG: 5-oxoprolinase subunit PxpB, partial [Catalinimonas sp.]